MKNREHLVVIITFILLPFFVLSQKSVSFKIVAGDNDRLDCPVFIDLSHKTIINSKNSISLNEITKSGSKSVNFQFDNEGQNGILFMDFPENRDFPEPMRVWPSNSIDDKGYLFFEFCPIRHNSWKMEHSQNYKLRYRLYVFDGNMSKEEAEAIWQAFAYLPEVVFEN